MTAACLRLVAACLALGMCPGVARAQTTVVESQGRPTLGGMRAGQQVRAEGRSSTGGTLRVERLRARDADGVVRIEGQLTAVDRTRGTVGLLGFTVTVPATARVVEGNAPLEGLAALRSGDRVEARAAIGSDGTLTANRLRRSPLVGNPRDEVEAPIERVIDDHTFELLGRRMILARGVAFIDERTSGASPTQLRRDDDEQQVEAVRLGSWGTLGGRVEGVYRALDNANLGETGVRDASLGSSLQIDAAANLAPKAQLYTKVQLGRAYAVDPGRALPGEVRVKEANVRLQVAGPVQLQAGRVRLRHLRVVRRRLSRRRPHPPDLGAHTRGSRRVLRDRVDGRALALG
jgi:hypothetical protein